MERATYQQLKDADKLPPLEPMHNKVIVYRDQTKDVTEKGIIIPDSAKKKTNTGTVIGAGPGTAEFPMLCKVGNKVIFGQFSGTEFEFEETEYLILSAVSDVIAIVPEKTK